MTIMVSMVVRWVTASMFIFVSACGGTDAEEPAQPEIIDPKGAEFAQRLAAARSELEGTGRQLTAVAPRAQVVGVREDVSCVWGNKGPLGTPDAWDSQCEMQRTFGILVSDPVQVMLKMDSVLQASAWNGAWQVAPGQHTVNPDDVRRGRVPAGKISRAGYSHGYYTDLTLQIGRTGQRQHFQRDSLGVGYFRETTGSDWEQAVPRGSMIQQPLIAVELTMRPFMRRPITA